MSHKSLKKEWIFQLIVHALVFVTFSVTRRDPQIEVYEFFFFVNYALAAAIINYIGLRRFLTGFPRGS